MTIDDYVSVRECPERVRRVLRDIAVDYAKCPDICSMLGIEYQGLTDETFIQPQDFRILEEYALESLKALSRVTNSRRRWYVPREKR